MARNANFQLKRSKVKVTGREKHSHGVTFIYGRQTANYAYAIVRPNLLSAPDHETLGIRTDGRMLCRHSAPT